MEPKLRVSGAGGSRHRARLGHPGFELCPADLAVETRKAGDQSDQFANGDFLAGPRFTGFFGFIVFLRCQENSLGGNRPR